jgi:RNA polymerase sigma factor (sigma-70 family)
MRQDGTTKEEEIELATLIQRGRAESVKPAPDETIIESGRAARDKLFAAHQPLMCKIVRQYARKSGLDEDDLYSRACEGLLEAINRFEPSRGRFSTFATAWIRKPILKALEEHHEASKRTAFDSVLAFGSSKAADAPSNRAMGRFHTELWECMVAACHTTAWLAKKLAVDEREVRRWRTGVAMPRPAHQEKLMAMYGKMAQGPLFEKSTRKEVRAQYVALKQTESSESLTVRSATYGTFPTDDASDDYDAETDYSDEDDGKSYEDLAELTGDVVDYDEK